MRPTEDGYQRTNREQSQEPRGKSFPCMNCDRALVHAGTKCHLCGALSGKARAKQGKPVVRE